HAPPTGTAIEHRRRKSRSPTPSIRIAERDAAPPGSDCQGMTSILEPPDRRRILRWVWSFPARIMLRVNAKTIRVRVAVTPTGRGANGRDSHHPLAMQDFVTEARAFPHPKRGFEIGHGREIVVIALHQGDRRILDVLGVGR